MFLSYFYKDRSLSGKIFHRIPVNVSQLYKVNLHASQHEAIQVLLCADLPGQRAEDVTGLIFTCE